jgi:ATP-dependent 26S proteasome regulatory subunit
MSKLDIYKKRKIAPKRGFLFGSEPGIGKSSLINYFCRQIIKMPKACILRVDSQQVSFETLIDMFSNTQESSASLILLVIEDIGGSGLEERAGRVDSEMLNFLDGNADVFKIPTLIVATTNYLDILNKTLTSRPGRFDIVREVEPPKDEEIIFLVEKFMDRELSADEKQLFAGTKMTPAYSKEAVLRHELYDIPLADAVTEVLLQRKKAESGSLKKDQRSMGFNDNDYENF